MIAHMFEPPPQEGYIQLWRRIIVDFLGRDESEVKREVDYWRDRMREPHGLFYHEPPEYYISHMLLPDIHDVSRPVRDRVRLSWALSTLIGRYQREFRLADNCFEPLRQEVQRVIDDFVAAEQHRK
jgi:hypothetical protein